MLLSAILSLVSLLATGITAQATFPAGFDLAKVPEDQKSAWCSAQSAACPAVCENFASVNRCNAKDLSYTCTCGDGSTPDLSKYKSTMPFFLCQGTYVQCIENHPDDLTGQRACKENQSKCLGSEDPFKKTSTSTRRPTKPQEAPTSESAPTPTNEPEEAAVTSNPASTLRVPGDSSTGILVALFLGVLRLFA
ncbi:hypothetical protein AJ79_08087 [Helicocarpus griseus UAMH5409]|uniref:DUF7707 domain-containing protein n=1 Tax=Helicocarpus griseus UAMH5409 TaxID=1447875 RepID=A0A2B7WVK5_9EURO|nr:hypothetical protein AJ79_08087 [Helicocarpus griseus UAMH5409]